MLTFSPGTMKQSPSPQHHSPAALRCWPREIQLSCAEAGGEVEAISVDERINETAADRAKHRNIGKPFCCVPARVADLRLDKTPSFARAAKRPRSRRCDRR